MGSQISSLVREFRVKAGITQAELGKTLGVSRQSIISIEKGHYVPSLPLALKIAQFFKCSTDDIFKLREGDRNG